MLRKIRVFIKVVEHGSLSGASNALDIAPSSVSRSIANLEQEVGATLILRNTRSISLTPQGIVFYEGAKGLVSNADQLILQTKVETGHSTGQLKISIFESFGRLHACDWVAEFLSLYPDTEIDLDLDNDPVDMLSEGIDLAIRIGRPADSSLKFRRLLSNQVILCAAPEYIKKVGTPETPSDLKHHNCLTLNNQRQRTYWYFSEGEQAPSKIHVIGNLSSKGGTPLLTAACKGLGVVMLASWMVQESIEQGKLVPLLENWHASLHPNTSGDIYALYPSQAFITPMLRLFIDFMVEKVKTKGFDVHKEVV